MTRPSWSDSRTGGAGSAGAGASSPGRRQRHVEHGVDPSVSVRSVRAPASMSSPRPTAPSRPQRRTGDVMRGRGRPGRGPGAAGARTGATASTLADARRRTAGQPPAGPGLAAGAGPGTRDGSARGNGRAGRRGSESRARAAIRAGAAPPGRPSPAGPFRTHALHRRLATPDRFEAHRIEGLRILRACRILPRTRDSGMASPEASAPVPSAVSLECERARRIRSPAPGGVAPLARPRRPPPLGTEHPGAPAPRSPMPGGCAICAGSDIWWSCSRAPGIQPGQPGRET